MANTFISLTDLVKLNDQNARDLGVTDILNHAPFLAQMHSTTASNGTLHHFIKQTTAPSVGFRAVSTGKDNSASGYTEVDITLKLLDATFWIDKAIADSYKSGADSFLAREGINQLQQAFFSFEQQIWYGTGAGNASGFSGLGDDTHFNAAAAANVINAGGTSANTGSSIWLVRSTPDEKNVTAVIGNMGNIEVGQPVVTSKNDDTTPSQSYSAYMTPIMAYCGLQIGSVYSAVRIGNLTADVGHTATDALIAKALALFPSYAPPTHVVMNRRSLFQLQASRTTYNPTGQPATIPDQAFNIPIVVTDSIKSTEALLA